MIASVIVELNVKSLDRYFDYLVPNELKNKLKIGHKVLVPFGNLIIEGFVIDIKNDYDKDIEYKSIIKIVNDEFFLKKELLDLGKWMANQTLSNLISCYQIMLPKALKANKNTNINKKYIKYVYLNCKEKVNEYVNKYPKRKKDIEIINFIKDKKILKSEIKSSLNNLINENIVLVEEKCVNREVKYNIEENKEISLTNKQAEIFNKIIEDKERKPFLLYGVTGSGKTEIYIKLIKYYLSLEKEAILLVPEISLTPQIVSRFKSVFGEKVAVIHSRLSEGEKYDEYRKIMNGEVKIVVGARSAVFAPFENIGIIIIDECQSATYKQESTPKYNGIDIAIERCKYHNALCLMGSATPLLEQYARGVKGIFNLLTLDESVSKKSPKIELVDMEEEVKKRNFVISEKLDKEINKALLNKNQIILLLNRRGYSTFLRCTNCGYVYKCPNCDISLTYHKSSNNLICHYCSYQKKMDMLCPECKEEAIKDLGMGTEKLESIIKEKYKNAKVIRMDADSTVKKGSYEKIIESFQNKEYDILIGTQMVSKGLNFKDVTLIGIINADASLMIPDFRSGERTFELLTQTAGRSARYDKDGLVLIQTYNKDNYVYNYSIKNNYPSFFNYEMKIRRDLNYPPYYNIVLLKVTSKEYELSKEEAKKIKNYLYNNLSSSHIILGPSTARILKLNNKYTFQIIIKYKYIDELLKVLRKLNQNYMNNKVNIDIDINPINII